MKKPINWTDIRTILKDVPNEALLDVIKSLYSLSPQNKAFIRAQLFPGQQDIELLEKSRKQVTKAIYSETKGIPHMPRFGESRKVIRSYQKATGDISGTLDLMLLHVERGTQFTNDFGDIEESFYVALETMLSNLIDLLIESSDAQALYAQFRGRFNRLERNASHIGWGYGDTVSDMLTDMRERMGDIESNKTREY